MEHFIFLPNACAFISDRQGGMREMAKPACGVVLTFEGRCLYHVHAFCTWLQLGLQLTSTFISISYAEGLWVKKV